jgi:hypothetical protein
VSLGKSRNEESQGMAAANSRHVAIIVRFSILAEEGTKGWNMTRTTPDMNEYRAALFHPSRLAAKFQMFEKMTLPSILSQTQRTFHLHLFTAESLPAPWMTRLGNLVAPYKSHVTIHKVDGMKSFRREVNRICEELKERYGENGFATTRLDDDDGVGPRFVERLSDPRYGAGSVVLFSKGKRYIMDRNVPRVTRLDERTGGPGSSIIGGNIYACGHHKTLHERFPTHIDETPDMFMLGCGDVCDTHRKAT